MKWNVAVYLRVSKEVDDLCETNSLDNQKLIIENFVNSNKDLVIKDYYIDNGSEKMENLEKTFPKTSINCLIPI